MLCLSPRVCDERGSVLVTVTVWLPVLIAIAAFTIDVGNWFEHRRHLQMQADAGALAGAQAFGGVLVPYRDALCPDSVNAAIETKVGAYSGLTYNAQIGDTPTDRIFRRVNSKKFADQPSTGPPLDTPDDTIEQPPCSAKMLDVKLTETGLPWFFKLLGAVDSRVKFINAQARVSVRQSHTTRGELPVGVPDARPDSARAMFINERTQEILGSTPLTAAGITGGLQYWDNSGAPLPVSFKSSDTRDADDMRVGVVVALGGRDVTTCGQMLVECYDLEGVSASGMPTKGIEFIRGWSRAGSGAQPGKPRLRGVELFPQGDPATGLPACEDPYFSVATAPCGVGLRTRVDFGTVNDVDQAAAVGAKVTASIEGGPKTPAALTLTDGAWQTKAGLPLSAAAGAQWVSLNWEETKGTLGADACKTGNGNRCTGSFGDVQRAFSATAPRSGPISYVQVSEATVGGANSFEQCSPVQTSCTHNLVVRIGVKGNLEVARDASDPKVFLRIVGGSRNQSLDCDPDATNLKDELAKGCAPTYATNDGSTPCPAGASGLWETAQPWQCVALQTGTEANQVPAGMNQRILGDEKPTSCTNHNHWSDFPNLSPSDPRIVQVFLTPFGTFSGSGSGTVPVTDFASFYVTGWAGTGSGFDNPCAGSDDDAPDGYIVGHFIKYINSIDTGTGTQPCDPNAFGSCVAVMTR